ncbi:MAG: zinc ribbon domain-containing protein [Deltaproteobacteria bacterium]|nr:zinc ribbon domain-containing protein [Deltaproteobacteria bacterium]
MTTCPSCQTPVPDETALFCTKCGGPVGEQLFDAKTSPLITAPPQPPGAKKPLPTPFQQASTLELDTQKKAPAPPTTRMTQMRPSPPKETRDMRGPLKKIGLALGLLIALLLGLRFIMRWAEKDAPVATKPAAPTASPAAGPNAEAKVERLLKMPPGKTPGGAFALQAELARNPNGDVGEAVERAMERGGSDGKSELQAMEKRISGEASDAVPEDRAMKQMDAIAERGDPNAVRALEAEAQRAPASVRIKAMLREVRGMLNPKVANALLGAPPQHAQIYTRALVGAGDANAALTALAALPDSDVRVLRARVEALSRVGRCIEAEPYVTKLAANDTIAAIATRVRHDALCTKDLASARELADTAAELPLLTPASRGSLHALSALLALSAGALNEAPLHADSAEALAPQDPVAKEAAARVLLARGEDGTKKLLRATDDARVLLAAAALKRGDRAAVVKELKELPSHHAGAAMVRVAAAVKSKQPLEKALLLGLDAALIDRWPGGVAIPFTTLELRAIAELGGGGELLPLADLLGGDPTSAAAAKSPTLRALGAIRLGQKPPPGLFAAFAKDTKPAALQRLLAHPVLAPHAAVALARRKAISRAQLAKLKAKFGGHPAWLEAAAILGG